MSRPKHIDIIRQAWAGQTEGKQNKAQEIPLKGRDHKAGINSQGGECRVGRKPKRKPKGRGGGPLTETL